MKGISFKFISIFCVFTLIMCFGVFPVKALGNENNLVLSRSISNNNENYNVDLNVKFKNSIENKNKDIILAIDENSITKEELSVLKQNIIDFTNNVLQDENCKISIVNLNADNKDNIINFTSDINALENAINNITYKKNKDNKINFLNLKNKLTNLPKGIEKYVVLFTDFSKNENSVNKVENEKTFENINFTTVNINASNNLKEQCQKIKANIFKDTILYKNFTVEDEVPNNFEVVSVTLNGKEYTPNISNDKVIFKISKMPLKGIEVKYTLKPKEKNLKATKLSNTKAYLEYDELTYKNDEKVNHEKVQFENCMVKDSENSKEVITKEQVPVEGKSANDFSVQENNQIGNIEIKNEVLSSDENENYKNQFWWSLNCLKNSQVVEGTFEGDSVNIPKLVLGKYRLTLCNPIDYEFLSIKVNGKEIKFDTKQQTNINIDIDENNANVKIEVVSKFSPKGYFHSSNAALDKFPLTIISD